MSTIGSVLMATDFSAEAARAARRGALIAAEHSAPLRLLHIARMDLLSELRARIAAPTDIEARVLDGAKRALETLAGELTPAAKSTPETIVRTGNVLEEILSAADHSDLLVLGPRGEHPAYDLLIGTTAERLLLKSRRPMLVVKREAHGPYGNVLVPVDFSTQSIGALRFAQEIAPQARIHLFHAYESPYEGKLRQADVTEETITRIRLQYRDQALMNMQNLLDKWGSRLPQASSSVDCGSPKLLVPTRAESDRADLIVLGKHGHSRVGEFFLGGVSRHTLARAKCDVAVVPDWPRL